MDSEKSQLFDEKYNRDSIRPNNGKSNIFFRHSNGNLWNIYGKNLKGKIIRPIAPCCHLIYFKKIECYFYMKFQSKILILNFFINELVICQEFSTFFKDNEFNIFDNCLIFKLLFS